MKTKAFHWFIFVASVLALAWYYDYPHWIMQPPQSIHNWRQADCASLTLNYYQQDLPFNQPQTHGMVSDGGASSKNAPSEIPLYYWGVGQLYRIFGPHEALLRGLNTLLFLSGICGLIWGIFRLSGSLLWSVAFGLLPFLSPVLVYYGSNYLTNAPSLGMALWAMSFLVLFIKTGSRKYWWRAVLFYLLAGSFKLPGLFLFFSVGGTLVLSWLVPRFRIPYLRWKDYFLAAALVLLPLVMWVGYANHYNAEHQTVYFSTTTFPIWKYTWPEIGSMVRQMAANWAQQYFHPLTYLLLIFFLLYTFVRRKHVRQSYLALLLVLLPGLLLYFLLQFFTFVDHDYYVINMFILPCSLVVIITDYLAAWKPQLMRAGLMKVALALFVTGNAIYAREQLEFRYEEYPNSFRQDRPLLYEPGTINWLDSLGVGLDDTIIFVPDFSNTSLYLLNRYGWTNGKMVFKDSTRNLYFNQDKEGVGRSIALGAEYLLVYGTAKLHELEYLHPFEKHLSGQKDELYVFDLRDTTRNFDLSKGEPLISQSFDFEDKLPPGLSPDQLTSGFALSGEQSVYALGMPYCGGLSFHDITKGMLVEVKVWIRKETTDRVVPVIQSEKAGLVFQQEERTVEKKGEWVCYFQSYIVEEDVVPDGIKVFIWNPAEKQAYKDDYQIQVYRPAYQ